MQYNILTVWKSSSMEVMIDTTIATAQPYSTRIQTNRMVSSTHSRQLAFFASLRSSSTSVCAAIASCMPLLIASLLVAPLDCVDIPFSFS
jgi:hypothetical protein